MKKKLVLIALALVVQLNYAEIRYVIVGNNYFTPASVTISVGDTVRWINGIDGGGVHNVVADDGSFTSGAPAFPWTYDHIFTSAGVLPYQCSDHGSTGMTGTIIVESATGIITNERALYNFELKQNYPNPFNPTTKISWQSPVSGHQTLKVYDVLGNEVVTLVNEYKSAGSYEVNFNASNLSSGIYFYQLKAGDPSTSSGQSFIETKKLTLIK
ncbi:T9SS type A sorting domain-containing protein [Ignavibacterium album]|uniref:T9SS type A sorting domain-containing protein n=1 Tax=Ignavibacterium album TaxID=591197 RepID=UPI0026EE961C|nr:T9SS type A sorting domain-containing protein [Ignavibacterium album]